MLQGENCGNWRFYYCPERIFECVFKHIFARSVWCSGVQTQSSSYKITDLLKIQKFLFDIFISCFGKGELLEVVAFEHHSFNTALKCRNLKQDEPIVNTYKDNEEAAKISLNCKTILQLLLNTLLKESQ